MALKTKHTVEDLKDEITELKLSDIRKDISSLKEVLVSELIDVKKELTETKEHVKKTNGSVAKITEQQIKSELILSNHIKLDADHWEELETVKKDTKVIRWLMNHPKVLAGLAIIPFMFLSVKGVEGIISVIEDIVKFIF